MLQVQIHTSLPRSPSSHHHSIQYLPPTQNVNLETTNAGIPPPDNAPTIQASQPSPAGSLRAQCSLSVSEGCWNISLLTPRRSVGMSATSGM
eukprot:scaffold146063_cov22-Tisochrysis_lutea.AAC.1